MRVEFDRGNGFCQDTRRVRGALPLGWTLEGWVRWERARVPRVGFGVYLGEPWGGEGPLWAVAFTLWAGTAGFGIRGVPPTPWWDESEESPDAP